MLKIKMLIGLVLSSAIAGTLLQSCEDVINLNLKDTTPRLVVEGSISNLSDSVKIMLHKSTDYFKPADFTAVTNALVSINDSRGNSYQLLNNMNGKYTITGVHAIPDDTFTLVVNVDGIQYTAIAQMPNLVKIDSLSIGKSPDHVKESQVGIEIKDPPGVANYYQVKVFRNDTLSNSDRYALYSDRYFDGKTTLIEINSRRFGIPRFNVNDTVKVQLINLDKTMYDYLQVLRDITDAGNILSASTPSNPPNNINNGALGYFAAYSISQRIVIIK